MNIGDNSKDFEELQDWLYENNFLSEKELCYSVRTKRAVSKLEEYLGHTPTGIFKDSYKQEFFKSHIVSFASYKSGRDNPLTTGSVPNVSSNGITNVGVETPCYIINTLTKTVIHLPHVPEEFSYSHGSNWDEQGTKGRSIPHINYGGGTSRTVDIAVTISADFCEHRNIDSILDKLEALSYPIYKDKILAPKCVFRCANFTVTGVIASVDITRKLPIINGSYSQADVSISFIEVFDKAPQASMIEKGDR